MPFSFGQVYDCTEDGQDRQATALQTRDDGKEADRAISTLALRNGFFGPSSNKPENGIGTPGER